MCKTNVEHCSQSYFKLAAIRSRGSFHNMADMCNLRDLRRPKMVALSKIAYLRSALRVRDA